MRNVLEPIFEREFSERSYGFRPGRGAKDALREVACLLDSGYRYIVDADIQGYFDAIPKTKLLASVKARVSDGRVLSLVSQYLNQPVMEGLNTWTPETGTPQGAVISPLLANIYLNPLDHILAGAGMEMRRYADDFVVLCRTRQEAETALDMIRAWMEEAELTLHPEKTCIVDMTQQGNYFEFLGYRFKYSKNRDYRFPTPRSLKKIREGIRAKTRRTHGHSLEHIIATINPLLRGWFEYFKHSHYTIPEEIDGWVRMRLRSILRKRAGRKGRGRGLDQNRYPNKFFAEYGLYCLKTAYAQAVQSPPG
jgi:RNA-directed DNA polymerase